MITSRSGSAPRRPALRWLRVLALVATVIATLLVARIWMVRSFDSGPLPPPLRIVRSLPVTLPNGKQATLSQMIRPGLPTVNTLWASWCVPCRLEAPHLVALRRRFGPDTLNLVYVNVRENGTPAADLAAYLSSVGMKPDDYVVMADKSLVQLTNDKQNRIPRTYVFDSLGEPTAMIIAYKPLALARIASLIDDYSSAMPLQN